MAETTKIAWTDATFNPWIGCTKVHAGCLNCYAETQNEFRRWNGGTWGPGAPRKVTSPSYWKQPLAWARAAAKAGERRRVFCGSLCDVLDKDAPAEAVAGLWELIRATAFVGDPDDREDPREVGYPSGPPPLPAGLDWLLLTKRPERWTIIPEDVRPLVWLGTSASDQPTWDEWVGRLVRAEGFGRLFVSLEPMVGPVDGFNLLGYCYHCDKRGIHIRPDGTHAVCGRPVVSWVIIGGESGPKARPCDVGWIRSMVTQCRAAGVAPFVKQIGARVLGRDCEHGRAGIPCKLIDSHGGNPDEWPEDLRVREFPEVYP